MSEYQLKVMSVTQRQTFSSRLTTVLTMTGVAVGLGNVWRFPYMMGRYGGSAFLLIFLFFVLAFAVPAAMAEWSLGRATRQGPLGAFSAAFGRRWGRPVGVVLSLTVLIANSYYLLVIAYICYTGWFSVWHGFEAQNLDAYNSGLGTGWLQYAIALVLLASCLWVLSRGLRRGIERVSVLFLPFFGVVVILFIIYTLSLDGALPSLLQFLKPDFAAMASPSNIFAAMGQAFFSLSLGGTFFVIYGSYLRESEAIPGSALLTGLGDAGAAVLASLFIVPTILVFGLEMDQGPTLIFDTLPRLFGTMPAGRLLGSLFLLGLTLVAFLSSIAALQVVIGSLTEALKMNLKTALLWIGLVEAVIMLPTALNPSWIGTLDLIFGSGMQCLGSGLAILALTVGLGKAKALSEILGKNRYPWMNLFFYWLQWVIPMGLLITLVMYMIENI